MKLPVIEWLKELPDNYRELAIAQCDKGDRECIREHAICYFADWEKTSEGWHFWRQVACAFSSTDKYEYPPLPNDIGQQITTSLDQLETIVRQWGVDEQILGPGGQGTVKGQFQKLEEELCELDFGVKVGDVHECKDAIGDMMVTLIMMSDMLGLNIRDCLQEKVFNFVNERSK